MSYSKIEKLAIVRSVQRGCNFASLYKLGYRSFFEISVIKEENGVKSRSNFFIPCWEDGKDNKYEFPSTFVSILITKMSNQDVKNMVEYCKKYCLL